MAMEKPASTLAARLAAREILVAPGVYDGLTASLAERAGFEALYVSGAALSYTRLGRPDIGLVSMSEVAGQISLIRDRVDARLIVDADTGYGNALNVQRTVRAFERAGAGALQIEDQTFPKRCGHLSDKSIVPAGEMVGKIKAAVDARASGDTLVIARTDAVAVEGFDSAIERANRYADAGADLLFVEAPRDAKQLAAIAAALGGRAPLMANMVEGGLTPLKDAGELEALGYSLVIFPGAVVRVIARAAQEFYAVLRRDGASTSFAGRMYDFASLNEMIGTADMLALGRRYDANAQRGPKDDI